MSTSRALKLKCFALLEAVGFAGLGDSDGRPIGFPGLSLGVHGV